MNQIKRSTKKEGGATLVEYALIVALLSIAVVATVVLVSEEIDAKFTQVIDCLSDPNSTACTGG